MALGTGTLNHNTKIVKRREQENKVLLEDASTYLGLFGSSCAYKCPTSKNTFKKLRVVYFDNPRLSCIGGNSSHMKLKANKQQQVGMRKQTNTTYHVEKPSRGEAPAPCGATNLKGILCSARATAM